MSTHDDPFASAVHTAHEWLNTIAARIGTEDRGFAHRVVRAWLHSVRDRIGVIASAHLSAQLPELLRGVYYEGWVPSHVPVGHRLAAFVTQFAHEAGVARDEVPGLAGAVTDAFTGLCSPGQLDHVFAVLPVTLRELLLGNSSGEHAEEATAAAPITAELLERRLQLLGDAVAVLACGLEQLPIGDVDRERHAAAAQQAHRILLAEGLTSAGR
jgi:uncharacterized protein (DUF2267 family)